MGRTHYDRTVIFDDFLMNEDACMNCNDTKLHVVSFKQASYFEREVFEFAMFYGNRF